MKTIQLMLLSAILLIGCAFTAQAQDKKSKQKKTEEVTFNVNMNCHNCQAKIEKNIPWEKGVKDLKVDLENKTVTVSYDPKKTDPEKLKAAFEKLEFTCEIPKE